MKYSEELRDDYCHAKKRQLTPFPLPVEEFAFQCVPLLRHVPRHECTES